MAHDPQSTALTYRMLTEPGFRTVRHAVLIAAVAAISLSQNFSQYGQVLGQIGGGIYLLSLAGFVLYLAAAYFHIYFLVPRYLSREMYGKYFVFSAGVSVLLVALRMSGSLAVVSVAHADHRLFFGVFPLLDSVSDTALNFLCFTGVSFSVLLKYWFREERLVEGLEGRALSAQLEAMKASADPGTLLSTIRQSGELAPTDPARSCGIILKLSEVLRYQLYEGGGQRVLAGSEIAFVRNYLELDSLRRPGVEHRVKSEGNMMRHVPPMAFLDLVKIPLSRLRHRGLSVSFFCSDSRLEFGCTGYGSLDRSIVDTAVDRLGKQLGTRAAYRIEGDLIIITADDGRN